MPMFTSIQTAADRPFYPPRVEPSRKPLRFPFNVTKLLSNNLEIIPEQAYREPLVIAPGPPRIAFFTGPELVKTALLSRHSEFPKGGLQVDVLKPMFGKAMISVEGREWRWQRSAAAPLFHHDSLLEYGPIMTAAAEAAVTKWRSVSPGAVHTINRDMLRAAFHVISNTMLAGGAETMLRAIEKGHAGYYRGANWWIIYRLLGLPHGLPRPGGKAMRAHETRLRAVVAELVKMRREETASGDDLLARLLRASDAETGQSMSNQLLADNILSFLIAGFDTTAFALTWTLYLIARSPEWEARILEEVSRVVGEGPVSSAHVAQLVTVQQVLKESLRLFPTAPVIVRDIVDDVEFDGVTVPKGTLGFIPIYAIHRHRGFWEDPDRFDPNRFSPDNPCKPSRYQYMPFGAGPRVCIGASFAMLEATIMLATFVRAAHFELDPGFEPEPSARMFLLPKNGMPMRVMLRQKTEQNRMFVNCERVPALASSGSVGKTRPLGSHCPFHRS
ncbi:MAG TPA: cytochrome P450 [Terriglobales bacterium]|nr:cytochrome P450 [Terriglobales bacterium]